MQEKNYDSSNVKKRYHVYSEDEKHNKYRFQKRWQENNAYIVKTYKLNGDTIKNLLQFSKENDMPQAKVLYNAFQQFKEKTMLGKFWQSKDVTVKSDLNKFLDSLMLTEDETLKTELSKFLQSITPSEDRKYGVKKNFKIYQQVALEIDTVAKSYKVPYGYFVTKILDDYMAEVNKTNNKSINEQNRNP